jgi:hypothetical protein
VADRIRCLVDDRQHLVIELDFEAEEEAEAFRQFLSAVVWANPEASPALASTVTTRILEPVSVVNAATG